MFIRCWGSRGSIPVSGKEYLKYGGDTTCLEIKAKSGEVIIVDAGSGIRRLGNEMIREGKSEYHMLFTHAHWDHLLGFPFFKPLFRKETVLKIHKFPFPGSFVKKIVSGVMTPPHFPVKDSSLAAHIEYVNGGESTLKIGTVSITAIPLSHPNGGFGYKFTEDDHSFVFLTDNELAFKHSGGRDFDDYVDFVMGADLLIHDAEYTDKEYDRVVEWGHSRYTDVLKLAEKAGVKRVGLFHLNQERSDSDMDIIVDDAVARLSAKGLAIDCFGVAAGMTFNL